jgi:hypothetical protein
VAKCVGPDFKPSTTKKKRKKKRRDFKGKQSLRLDEKDPHLLL